MFLSDPNNFLIQLVEKEGAFGMFFGFFKSCPPQTALSNEGEKNNWVLPKFDFCFLWDDCSNLLRYMYLWSVYSHEINRESFPFKRGKVKWS